MAFDGITISALKAEFEEKLLGGRIYKVAQPEDDELTLTIKNNKDSYKLLMSANPSLPLIYITEDNKPSPATAPTFCMFLRKHLTNGRISAITQPDMERVLQFEVEHLDEMGDLKRKYLIIELMGKYSNIILCGPDFTILDSIKHVPAYMSSVREVLPGRDYFIPKSGNKLDPTKTTEAEFIEKVFSMTGEISKAILGSYTGISPIMAEEVCYEAGIDGKTNLDTFDEPSKNHIAHTFVRIMKEVSGNEFCPAIINKGNEPVEFSALSLTLYTDDEAYSITSYTSISEVINDYYSKKSSISRIRQHSADLRLLVGNMLERNYKKYELQLKQLKDTEKRDKFKVYGELINTYGYSVEDGAKEFRALNYYTNEEITIPLDPDLSVRENSVKYFDKYNKLKRTFEALTTLTQTTKDEIDHLESISNSLDIAVSYDDLVQIKQELVEYGYIKKHNTGNKKEKILSKPFHYISSDGFDMYVGKNNYQNEELTFKIATGNDWWFHAKGIPGSHVIVKCENKELPDRTFEEAARLAAHYSKAKDQEKVDVDYIQKKQIKKPNASKPGFVIYHTNYSMTIDNDETKMGKMV